MPDWTKVIVGLGLIVMGTLHIILGLFRKPADYARAAFGIGLLLMSMGLSACGTGPTPLAHVKYRPCINHDLQDRQASNAMQDC